MRLFENSFPAKSLAGVSSQKKGRNNYSRHFVVRVLRTVLRNFCPPFDDSEIG